MNNQFGNQRLNAKDLINIGIFTAVYFVLFFVAGMTGYIPIMMVFLPLIAPILCAIPFMLYLTKIRKFGMVTITGIIVSLLMFSTGHGWTILATGIAFPLLADIIMKSGNYQSWKKTVIGYAVFTEWTIGAYLPIWIMRESYEEMLRAGYGDAYADQFMAIMSGWMLLAMIVLAVVGAVIGAYIGRAALKKHFKRAGIA